ncbi:cytochrome P450 52A11 [Pyricularia oryzae]|nr:cytochrome P450 52A11 [Pyricularia oryzae]
MFNLISSLKVGAALVAAVWIWQRIMLYNHRRKIKRDSGCLPAAKFPDWDPLFGIGFTYHMVTEDILDFQIMKNTADRLEKYGNTFTSKAMGFNFIWTCEPENIKAVLSTQFDQFNNQGRSVGAEDFLGKGIFVSDGEHWQKSRALVRPNFARDQITDLVSVEERFQTLISLLPKDGSTVDLLPFMFDFTMDTSTHFLFGDSVKSLEANAHERSIGHHGQENLDEFSTAWDYAQNDMLSRFVLGPLRYVYKEKKAARCIKLVQDHVEKYVDEAIRYNSQVRAAGGDEKKEPEERYIFLRALAKQTQDRRMLRDELLNILVAGRDTTASLLSNMLHTMANRPDIWTKLKNEVAFLQGRIPTYEDIRNMKYMRWCINESLRLHTVLALVGKEASIDTTLPRGGGPDHKAPIFVAKGTFIAYSFLALHRRKDLFGEDAHEFKPERWETLRPGWNYLPFNGGPRICVGQQYALTEAQYVLIRFLQTFSAIESRDPEPWSIGNRMTTCPKNGVQVSLRC